MYSRVARVCKHDEGIENEQIWKSFEKARLNCSISSNLHFTINRFKDHQQASANHFEQNDFDNDEQRYPFYFDQIQDIFFDKRKNLVYAIFTTPK